MDSTLKPPHTYVSKPIMISYFTDRMRSFTEKDWNTISPAACEKDGKNASGSDKYRGRSYPVNSNITTDFLNSQ